jgi:hypothetical protein
MCVLDKGHKGNHKDAKGREFDHARYIRNQQLPDTAPDIYWMLDENTTVIVTKRINNFVVQEQDGPTSQHRRCVITYSSKGRMLFDGFDIDTEDFMVFVGMLDAVEDSLNKKVKFTGDEAEDL